MKKLYKSVSDRRICGVCGGLAEYLNVDPSLLRIIVTVLFFAGSISLWVYIIAAIILPDAPEGVEEGSDNGDAFYTGNDNTGINNEVFDDCN